MTKRWVQVPRNKEGPEPVYLAKVPDRPRKRGDVVVEVIETAAVAAVRRRVPPPKRKAKPRGRKPGPKKTVSFAEERLRTFPVVVPHNSDPNAPGGPTPGGVPLIPGAAATTTTVITTTSVDTEMTDADAAKEQLALADVVIKKQDSEEEEEEEKMMLLKLEELPEKPVLPASVSAAAVASVSASASALVLALASASASTSASALASASAERKAHPLPPRPAGLPPKPIGAANLVNNGEHMPDAPGRL